MGLIMGFKMGRKGDTMVMLDLMGHKNGFLRGFNGTLVGFNGDW